MKTPNSPTELADAIASMISSYMNDVERTTLQAIERALHHQPTFGGATMRRKSAPAVDGKLHVASRRSTAELGTLSESLRESVRANPGASMAQLAEKLGASVRALERPMAKLKSAGQVRTVGARQSTRYFPGLGNASSSDNA